MWLACERFGGIAEVRTGRRWTGRELAHAVQQRAAVLKTRGLGPGARALIKQGGTCDFFADLFAVWDCGACAICVSPSLTSSELANVAGFLMPGQILCGRGEADPGIDLPAICLADEIVSSASIDVERHRPSIDDDALILLTSGTTGMPKGVVHTFRSLAARLALNRAVVGHRVMATTLCVLPVHFGHGLIGNCLTPLVAGCELVMASDLGPGMFANLDRILETYRVTFMSSVPTTWNMVRRSARRTVAPGLKRVHVGSAALSAALWRWIVEWCGTDDVVNAYGLTETANWVAGASARVSAPTDGLVGRMWGGTAAVLREDGRLCASGEGEIVLQSPAVMRGYFQRPDLDGSTWIRGWLRTRDLGHVAADGTIHLLARLGEDVNRGGTKVYPQDIEQLLGQHEAIGDVCAFGMADEILGHIVGVAVVLRQENGSTLDEVKSWCAARLSREKIPDRWYVVDAIPRSDRGKVNRRAVAAHCAASVVPIPSPVLTS